MLIFMRDMGVQPLRLQMLPRASRSSVVVGPLQLHIFFIGDISVQQICVPYTPGKVYAQSRQAIFL